MFHIGQDDLPLFHPPPKGCAKFISCVPWEGNPTPRIMETASGMINAVGLQNPGMVEYITKEIKKKAAQPVSMKLTPNVTDITEIAKAAEAGGADALSLINIITGMRIDVKKRAFCVANKTGGGHPGHRDGRDSDGGGCAGVHHGRGRRSGGGDGEFQEPLCHAGDHRRAGKVHGGKRQAAHTINASSARSMRTCRLSSVCRLYPRWRRT